ncbi:hypothetical protein [Halomonas campaniensis]|uniref:hypothetical protein n=1 Tax=Halomonas campaniensis TaxID=213554 RepID=UPI0039708C6E
MRYFKLAPAGGKDIAEFIGYRDIPAQVDGCCGKDKPRVGVNGFGGAAGRNFSSDGVGP